MRFKTCLATLLSFFAIHLMLYGQVLEEPADRYMQTRTSEVEITTETGATKVRTEGWLEYTNERYTVELSKGIGTVRLLRLTNAGNYQNVRTRLESIRERLEYAFDLLLKGNQPRLRLRRSDKNGVGIFCSTSPSFTEGDKTGRYPVRILTIHDQDAEQFPSLDVFKEGQRRLIETTKKRLASYLAAQIEAHFTLFIRIHKDYKAYEGLTLDETAKGKIYREVFIRSQDVLDIEGNDATEINEDVVDDALDRMARQQRARLQRRYYLIPRDWELKADTSGTIFRSK